MPSIQQLSGQQQSQMPAKPKYSAMKKCTEIAIWVVALGLAYMYFKPTKIIKIPDSAYATREHSLFKELFETPYRKVIWFGGTCPGFEYKKQLIDTVMKNTKLDQYYIHRPFLQNSITIRSDDELGQIIMKNCSEDICIIFPSSHKIFKTTEKRILNDMIKYTTDNSLE